MGRHVYLRNEHGEDEARKFYCFVSQYLQDHGYKMNQRAMNDAIKGMIRQRGFALGKAQEQRLSERVTSAGQILDFLKVTGRW